MRSPPEPEVLLTLAGVAERLHKHPQTFRKMLPDLMARNPNLRGRELGRSSMFTERDFDRLMEAIAWRPPFLAPPRPGRAVAHGGSGARASRHAGTAREILRECHNSTRVNVAASTPELMSRLGEPIMISPAINPAGSGPGDVQALRQILAPCS